MPQLTSEDFHSNLSNAEAIESALVSLNGMFGDLSTSAEDFVSAFSNVPSLITTGTRWVPTRDSTLWESEPSGGCQASLSLVRDCHFPDQETPPWCPDLIAICTAPELADLVFNPEKYLPFDTVFHVGNQELPYDAPSYYPRLDNHPLEEYAIVWGDLSEHAVGFAYPFMKEAVRRGYKGMSLTDLRL